MANSADPDQKPTDLDLHCLQRQGISGTSRARVNILLRLAMWISQCVSSYHQPYIFILHYSQLCDFLKQIIPVVIINHTFNTVLWSVMWIPEVDYVTIHLILYNGQSCGFLRWTM